MLLSDYINRDLIICGMKSKEKDKVIDTLSELLEKEKIAISKEKIVENIKKRESIESTAIGGGVAIPHVRTDSVDRLTVVFANSPEGVDFNSHDKKPVNIIFFIAAPLDKSREYLQVVAKISRLLKSNIIKDALKQADVPEKVMEIIEDFDGVLEHKIKTQDGRIIYKDDEKK